MRSFHLRDSLGFFLAGIISASALQPIEHPVPVDGRPASGSPLFQWNADDLTTHQFDLIVHPGHAGEGVPKLHVVFNSDGSVIKEAAGPDDTASVRTFGHWKINGTDLDITDADGKLVDYWRLVAWDEKAGKAEVGLQSNPAPSPQREARAFRVAIRPPYAPLVADAYEPGDDGGSLPLQEVTATLVTPGASHFEMFDDHICVAFTIEGRPVRFLVDTGAYGSIVTPEVAAALLDAKRKTDLHIGGYGPKVTEDSEWTRKVKLELPGVSCRASLLVYKLDLRAMHLDGLLGMDIMAQLRVRIDYLHQSITFSPPDAGTVPNMRGFIVLSKRQIHVPVTLTSDPAPPLTGSMLVDTGASGTFTIEHHPGLPLQVVGNGYIEGIGGVAKVEQARLSSITLADVCIRAIEADVIKSGGVTESNSKVLGAVGGAVLRRFCLTLDLPHRHVYFEPYTAAMDDPDALPELPKPAPPAPMSDEMIALLAKAQSGDVTAQRKLGVAYAKGDGIVKDTRQAEVWLEKAAEKDDGEAEAQLARLYVHGDGVPLDGAKAFALAQKSAAKGVALGENGLGGCYLIGIGVKKDPSKALEWLEKAAAQKNPQALANLGGMYQDGMGVPRDEAKAFELTQQGADLGGCEAQYNLALLYQDGTGTKKDLAQALEWYQKSAGHGFPDAQHNLALMFEDGLGLKQKDVAQAITWYEKAADQDYVPSLRNLELLAAGSDTVRSYFSRTRARYAQEAAGGDAASAMSLAQMYALGLGVPQDYHTATLWDRQAAALHSAEGEKGLGDAYARGYGVPPDDAKAVAWYQKAVGDGDAKAIVALAGCYETGMGVPFDLAKAKELYHRAADGGSELATDALARLEAPPAMDIASVTPPESVVHAKTSNSQAPVSGLIPWKAAALTGTQFDLVADFDWLRQRGMKLHAVFRPDGTMSQDYVDRAGAPSIHSENHWKIDGADLVITDAAGKQVNIWRQLWRFPNSTALIGLSIADEQGMGRFARKFQLTKVVAAAAPVPQNTSSPPSFPSGLD